MKIDKDRISGKQFLFTLVFYLQSSALLTSFLAGITKQEAWISVLGGYIVCLPVIAMYRGLMLRFPGRNLLQIMEEVYGVWAGKTLGLGYIWLFITLTALNLTDLGDFIKLTVMEETPHFVLALMCILLVGWTVRYGIRVVTRYALPFAAVEFCIVAVSVVLSYNQMDFQNFLPVFEQPAIRYVQGIHINATIPFGELVLFLMITPTVRMTRRESARYWFLGTLLGMLTLLTVLSRDIAMLGNTLHLFALPGLVTLRMVNAGEALSRMEILFAAALVMLLAFKITVICYAAVIAVAQLFGLKEFRHLSLVMGALVLVYARTLYANPVEHTAAAREVEPIIFTFLEFVLPILTVVVAKLRRLPKAKEE